MQPPAHADVGAGLGLSHSPGGRPRLRSRDRPRLRARPVSRSRSTSPAGQAYKKSAAAGSAGGHPLALLRAFDELPSQPARPSPLTASTVGGIPLDVLDRLRSFPLFGQAPDSFLAEIGNRLHPQLCHPNATIIREGDDASAMFWLVRGAVRVTSRDEESTYSQLRPGAFFGEIGVLMDMPRTASVVAVVRSLALRLAKDDLHAILPRYPEVERAIRDEAAERLSILTRLKQAAALVPCPTAHIPDPCSSPVSGQSPGVGTRPAKRPHTSLGSDSPTTESPESAKKTKPSPGLVETAASSILANSSSLGVRQLLQLFPLFASLPADLLHTLGINAQLRSYHPFVDIIRQGSSDRDLYFIVRGEVEVVVQPAARSPRPDDEPSTPDSASQFTAPPRRPDDRIQARLRTGQYFGEVASLALAPTRTATVRSISQVECLMISESLLESLWQQTPTAVVREQIEMTAKQRLENTAQSWADSSTVESEPILEARPPAGPFPSPVGPSLGPGSAGPVGLSISTHLDPDPFLSPTFNNVKSRWTSLAPAAPAVSPPARSPDGRESGERPLMGRTRSGVSAVSAASPGSVGRPSSIFSSQFRFSDGRAEPESVSCPVGPATTLGRLPTAVLNQVFCNLGIDTLIRLRQVSSQWRYLLYTLPGLVSAIDLYPIRRKVTCEAIEKVICPFINQRPVYEVNISDCHQIGDPTFLHIVRACGPLVKTWRMRSVWDVSGQAILEMAVQCRNLESIDLSNCRKINDQFMAYIIGWGTLVHQPQQQRHRPVGQEVSVNRVSAQPGTTAGTQDEQVSPATVSENMSDKEDGPARGGKDLDVVQSAGASTVDVDIVKDGEDSAREDDDDEEDEEDEDEDEDEEGDEDEDEDEDEDDEMEGETSGSESGPEDATEKEAGGQARPADTHVVAAIPRTYPTFMTGLPHLTTIRLSYCKHVTDRTMAHLAYHAADRLEELDLTRCTSITDGGFLQLGATKFPRLKRVCLADCTYLTDNAILWLVHAAQAVIDLDLSFCCALSDIATEVISMGCSRLRRLNMSFCGSAISDLSLRAVGLHLLYLRQLSVRGCVRVTGAGVESVVAGCSAIQVFDVSQCRHLQPWIDTGGIERMNCERYSRRFSINSSADSYSTEPQAALDEPNPTTGSTDQGVPSMAHHQTQPVHPFPHQFPGSFSRGGPAVGLSVRIGGALPDLPPSTTGSPIGDESSDWDFPPASYGPINFILDAGDGWQHWNRV